MSIFLSISEKKRGKKGIKGQSMTAYLELHESWMIRLLKILLLNIDIYANWGILFRLTRLWRKLVTFKALSLKLEIDYT